MSPFFRKPTFEDQALGQLTRRGARWWTALELPRHGPVAVGIAGPKSAPDQDCLALARELPGRYEALVESIQRALFEHCEPYLESVAAGELSAESAPRISSAVEVWPHVTLVEVRIEPRDWGLTIELGYETAWDIEHRLGARIHAWRLVELCGSI